MKQNTTVSTCYCSHCHRELPAASFYVRGGTNRPDYYCIDCRKEMSRTRYRKSHLENPTTARHPHPTITDVADDRQRLTLILHALRVVRESVARKRRKQREKELADDLPYP